MNLEAAREHLLRHAKSKSNGVFPLQSNFVAKMTNPICGDFVEWRLFIKDQKIEEAGHKTAACAICSASTSILCEQLAGQSLAKILEWGEVFETEITRPQNLIWPAELAPFSCFEHLRVNPARRMCALLPWVSLKSEITKVISATAI